VTPSSLVGRRYKWYQSENIRIIKEYKLFYHSTNICIVVEAEQTEERFEFSFEHFKDWIAEGKVKMIDFEEEEML
jgi:PII-like signaling protein